MIGGAFVPQGMVRGLNTLSDRLNPTQPSGFAGELHALELDFGNPGILARHNFTGPGTALKERLARGDRPINALDKLSMKHDIQYSNATSLSDIARADEEFVENAKRLPGRTAAVARRAIQTKIAAQGVLDKLNPLHELERQREEAIAKDNTPSPSPAITQQDGGFAFLLPMLATLGKAALAELALFLAKKAGEKIASKIRGGAMSESAIKKLPKPAITDIVMDRATAANVSSEEFQALIKKARAGALASA